MASKRAARRAHPPPQHPLERVTVPEAVCLELEDHSQWRVPAATLFPAGDRRTAGATHARLAEQFLSQNRKLLGTLGVLATSGYDGNEVFLSLEATSYVGAVPLVSPLSGRPDYGVVVQPRFPWRGLGPMLGQMGWRVVPHPLRLPLLRRSERRVPPWVISLMVLRRLELLVHQLSRRFEFSQDLLSAPKGTVLWGEYITRQLTSGRPDRVPCRYPDLRDDRVLKGIIRWTAERQVRSLSTQVEHGSFVHQLLERANALIAKVRDASPVQPTGPLIQGLARLPLRSEVFQEGLEAIVWTAEERGLAGLCDLEGIPWVMDMEQFFEAWIECLLERTAQHVGGLLRRGRLRQTQVPIRWERPSTGTQFSLLPDFVLEAPDFVLIADAKYKRHLDEFVAHTRHDVSEEIRERHREDLLQVLAYSSLYAAHNRIALLAYPCRKETWESLKRRGLLVLKAEVSAAGSSCQLWLCSCPMEASLDEAAAPLIDAIREMRQQAA